MSRGSIRVGASGWSYNDWVGDFYPADSEKEEWTKKRVRRKTQRRCWKSWTAAIPRRLGWGYDRIG